MEFRDYYQTLGVTKTASDAEIKRAITQGVSKSGAKLFPPMGYSFYAKVKDEDLDAIVAYLRSLKPLPRAN